MAKVLSDKAISVILACGHPTLSPTCHSPSCVSPFGVSPQSLVQLYCELDVETGDLKSM